MILHRHTWNTPCARQSIGLVSLPVPGAKSRGDGDDGAGYSEFGHWFAHKTYETYKTCQDGYASFGELSCRKDFATSDLDNANGALPNTGTANQSATISLGVFQGNQGRPA